ncbi:suppressor of fused domain protein [Tuwongella immobilis]|uniref:Uncharacterized protein n=1 Tax=Tuwongella immobilis TaxID=692036 RepID=A0A6C2YK75_9BACT|nr:suppressor of fused domain protein [Tuwongella immobilis]VIP01777.1 Uncharacterized protein OS=Vibrio nigripulchritudo ATCC 27043 GN=VINI7043_01310 PE=4 SV=1: SUFU [Tuwongella immobilis]VTR99418.1 Uncharacterized protein OS=Vibrio nigripulchritudo ATCC 27043 GN=VINI7043_01310 PE=4 SV=1: SUFU [Tuwongella immobilis]
MAEESWGMSDEYERLLDATGEARMAYFRTLGVPDADVWAPLVTPAFMGGPAWPTRPAWQRIRVGERTTIASSGLSDPFSDEDGPNVGFGVEMAVASTEPLPTDLRPSWLLDLAQAVSDQAAADGRFQLRHAKFGLFLFGVRMAASDFWRPFADAKGYCGLLLGQSVPRLDPTIRLPTGEAVLLTAKLLTRSEYEFAASAGPEGAQRLGELFAQDGSHHLSSLQRASVI